MGNIQSFRRRRKPRLTFSSFFSPFPSSSSTTSSSASIDSRDSFMEGFIECLGDNYISQIISSGAEKSHLLNELYGSLFGSYYSSPISTNLKLGGIDVLEIGCGSAGWLLTMAAQYPESNFTGMDVSQIFPTDCMPPNVNFIQIDSMKELPFENDSFDFIFAINFFAYCPEKQIDQQIFPELYRVLKPGGWLELSDFDGRSVKNMGPNTKICLDLASFTLRNWGIRFLSAVEILSNCFKRHFKKHYCEIKYLKQSKYETAYLGFSEVLLSMRRPLMEFTSMGSERFDEILKGIKDEYEKYDTSVNLCRLYAQKSMDLSV